jgi:hypothetical protein
MQTIATDWILHDPTTRWSIKPSASLHRLLTGALLPVLLLFFSVYVPSLEPKIGFLLTGFCLLLNGKQTLSSRTLPLLLIIGYGAFMGLAAFPGAAPNPGLILQRSLWDTACVLLVSVCLLNQSLRRHYLLIAAILLVTVIGIGADITGHDPVSHLPFQMPNDEYFDRITVDASGSVRLRGFYPEAGILGGVTIALAAAVAMGSVVLMLKRRHRQIALAGFVTAVLFAGAVLCLTVTKAGIVVWGAGIAAFLFTLITSRNRGCRRSGLAACSFVLVCAVVFAIAAPREVTSYYKGQVAAMAGRGGPARRDSGMVTRSQCWKLALYSVRDYPLGLGGWGLGRVLSSEPQVTLTDEMKFFFQRDMFGLKNGLANLMTESGAVGLGLLAFWLWWSFARPAWRYRRLGSVQSTLVCSLYAGSAAMALAFLSSCEIFPCLALALFLKSHADAVANATVKI